MKIARLLLGLIIVCLLVSVTLPSASANLIKIESIPDVTLVEDEEGLNKINLNNYFTCDNGNIYFSSISADKKIEINIHDDGSVDFYSPKNWYGTEKITFTASDGEQQVSDTILVAVIPKNDQPLQFAPLPDTPFEFEEDSNLLGAFNLYSHFTDIDSTLCFSYLSESIIVHIGDDGIVDFSAPKDWFGSEEVIFFASDGQYEISDTVLVNVKPVNDAPRQGLNPGSISLKSEDGLKILKLGDYLIDVDDEVLTYEIMGNKKIMAEIDIENEQIILHAPEDWSGEEVITIRAMDSQGETSSVQIVVIVSHGHDYSGQIFYLLGIVFAIAITGVRLHLAGRRKPTKSPVNLQSYRHYRGK